MRAGTLPRMRSQRATRPARASASAARTPSASGVCWAYRRVGTVEEWPRYRLTSSSGIPLLTRSVAVAWRIRCEPKHRRLPQRRLPGHEEQPEAASRYSGSVHSYRFGVTMSRAAPAKTGVASARGLPPLVAALSGL
jgi:hypothetical protein